MGTIVKFPTEEPAGGMVRLSGLRPCAYNRKVVGSNPNQLIDFTVGLLNPARGVNVANRGASPVICGGSNSPVQ